jgi:SAM-dependent methyltransferase
MPINTISHSNKIYLSFQSQGNAAQFIIPFAKKLCTGLGYDIGYCREEWKLPGATGIDIGDGQGYDANNLPAGQVDYIFSSHCLEHVENWMDTLDYWHSHIKKGGVLFLYLPDFSQTYWRPWNNKKHRTIMNPDYIRAFLESKNCSNIFVSGIDLNNSFTIVCEI